MSGEPVVVIGGGISGLAAAVRLADRLGPDAVTLLEADQRLGGKIETQREGEFIIESGPDCFLAGKPGGLAFCRLLGLEDRLVPTRAEHRGSFVRRGERLHPLPEGLSGLVPSRILPLMRSTLLSPVGRLRALAETAVPRRLDVADESVASFARRRFGAEAYDWLLEPLLGGIHAGNGEQLSLGAAFPGLRRAERLHGSLLGQAVRWRSSSSSSQAAVATGFLALREGMGELVDAAESRLRNIEIRRGWPVARLEKDCGTWLVHGSNGSTIRARAVVVATDGRATSSLLRPIDAGAADLVATVPHVSTAVVTLAFPRSAFATAPRGYGYLSPRAAGGPLVACSFSSNKLPGRAPDDHVLLRCFFGRAGAEEIVEATDAELTDRAIEELRCSHDVSGSPNITRVRRWRHGLPQYHLGHTERMAAARERLQRFAGIAVAGAIWRGVGIPDCIESGWEAADITTANSAAR